MDEKEKTGKVYLGKRYYFTESELMGEYLKDLKPTLPIPSNLPRLAHQKDVLVATYRKASVDQTAFEYAQHEREKLIKKVKEYDAQIMSKLPWFKRIIYRIFVAY